MNELSLFRKILVSILIILVGSCLNHSSPLDDFLDHLEERITNEEALRKYKHAPKDSLELYFKFFSKDFFEELGTPEHNQSIYQYLNNNGIFPDTTYRTLLLIFAFHEKLNDKFINLEKIKEDILQTEEILNARINREEELYEKENLRIIQFNNSKWNVGDTMNFILPVKIQNDGKRTTYFAGSYPYTLDYSLADDTLKVRAILIDKEYNKEVDRISNPQDLFKLVFKLKLLELSNVNTYNFTEKYEVGDEYDLPLKYYGRPIE